MQDSQIPTKFPIPFAKNAGAGYIRFVPQASQIGITAGAASLNDGFPPLTFQPVGAGGAPPWGQDVNGLLNQVTAWNQWQQAGGTVTYDATFSTQIGGYPAGAVLLSATTQGLFWLNIADNNTNNPDVTPTNWLSFGPAATGALPATSYVHIGTDTGSANAVTVATVSPTVSSVLSQMIFEINKVAITNTGPMTATIAGSTGAIVWPDLSPFLAGDWPSGSPALLMWDGTRFRMLSTPGPTVWARASQFLPNQTINFYVNSSIGNDSNDGLSAGAGHAFLTLQGAVNAITSRYLVLNTAVINVADGSGANAYAGCSLVASGIANWAFNGDITTPANCTISSPSTAVNFGRGIVAYIGSVVTVRGFSFATTLENLGVGGGQLTVIGNCAFSAPSNATSPCLSVNSGKFQLYGTNTYTGALASFVQVTGGGVFLFGYTDPAVNNNLSLTATGTTSFSTAFAAAANGATVQAYPTVVTFAGSPTGPRYVANSNGVINTQGSATTYLPGTTSGSTATGGQYV